MDGRWPTRSVRWARVLCLSAFACSGSTSEDTGVDASNVDAPMADSSVDARVEQDVGADARADANVDAADAIVNDSGVAEYSFECLARGGPRVAVEGEQFEQYRRSSVEDGTVFDARTATWSGLDDVGEFIPWTVTFRNGGSGAESCWFGGIIRGAWDDTAPGVTWEDPYHHSGGMTIDLPGFLVEAVVVENQGDGIRPYAPDVRIRGVELRDIHDDCIENDDLHSLVVEDSLLDGCYVGLSARPVDEDLDGSANLWEIRDTLLRLEPQPTVYRGASPGHGGFFKWDGEGRSPRVRLHDTVFRADQLPNHGTIGIPESVVFESCSGNVMVWLGEGDFPEALPDCIELTTDVRRWDDAVAAWRARAR